jgi:hypothetical protein
MQPNDLEQLLQRADRAAEIRVALPAALANRARHRVRRQQQVRVAIGATAGVALLLFVVNFTMKHAPDDSGQDGPNQLQVAHVENAPPIPVVDLEAKIKALRAEADRLESIVRANSQASSGRVQTASIVSPSTTMNRSKPSPIPPQLLIEQEAEITARVMVEQANRWMTQTNRRDDGIRSLERAIKLFPNTAAAKIAQNRLDHMKKQSGVTI